MAELEATTARKGNRKVKSTISGHVNETLIFWDDGFEKNQYVVSNNNSRTRFRFVGDAKIDSYLSAGYLLEIGARYANSGNRNQTTPAVAAIRTPSTFVTALGGWSTRTSVASGSARPHQLPMGLTRLILPT